MVRAIPRGPAQLVTVSRLLLCALACSAGAASAAIVGDDPNGSTAFGFGAFVAADGPVSARLTGGGGAGFRNELFLFGFGGTPLLSNRDPVGTRIDLGSFAAGTELAFGIQVRDEASGDVVAQWRTGPGTRNADGLAHARVFGCTDSGFPTCADLVFLQPGLLEPGETLLVGFEDSPGLNEPGGGPADFNDLSFTLTNASVAVVPIPAAVWLLAGALGGLGLFPRRRLNA